MLIGLPVDSARSMTILVHLLVEEGNARTWVHPSRIFLVRELPASGRPRSMSDLVGSCHSSTNTADGMPELSAHLSAM